MSNSESLALEVWDERLEKKEVWGSLTQESGACPGTRIVPQNGKLLDIDHGISYTLHKMTDRESNYGSLGPWLGVSWC